MMVCHLICILDAVCKEIANFEEVCMLRDTVELIFHGVLLRKEARGRNFHDDIHNEIHVSCQIGAHACPAACRCSK